MTVKDASLSMTLPEFLLKYLGGEPQPPPAGKKGEDRAGSSQYARQFQDSSFYSLKSFFDPQRNPPSRPLIAAKIKPIYQGSLRAPFNKCRHAVLKMIGRYLRKEFSLSRADVRKILPREIYNGDVMPVLPNWRPSAAGFKGPVRKPPDAALDAVLAKIDEHLDAKLPVPVYVSHTHGVHVVLVTDKIKTGDGRAAYLFTDPGTSDPQKSRGVLVWRDDIEFKRRGRARIVEIGNFVKPGNTNKRVKGTLNQQYYLLGLYPYVDQYRSAVCSSKAIARTGG